MITNLTDATFDEFVASFDLVLVDFWASWCPHCMMIAPILDQVADEDPRVAIAKLNIEEYPETYKRFEVQTLPTLLIFKEGELVDRIIGSMGKGALLDALEQHMGL